MSTELNVKDLVKWIYPDADIKIIDNEKTIWEGKAADAEGFTGKVIGWDFYGYSLSALVWSEEATIYIK